MSVFVMKEIIYIAMGDEIFRHSLVMEPDEVLAKYELTFEELKALRTGDKKKMVEMGLEESLAQYGYWMFSKKR